VNGSAGDRLGLSSHSKRGGLAEKNTMRNALNGKFCVTYSIAENDRRQLSSGPKGSPFWGTGRGIDSGLPKKRSICGESLRPKEKGEDGLTSGRSEERISMLGQKNSSVRGKRWPDGFTALLSKGIPSKKGGRGEGGLVGSANV